MFFKKDKTKDSLNLVFIVGCGRSGTTILGKTLSNHSQIFYLNERRDLWHKAYPELDIWSGKYLNPKMFVDRNDVHHKKTEKIKTLFSKEKRSNLSSLILEKLPINNFRLDFLIKIFPNAKFIYLHRNGLEVSHSIKKKIVKGNWWGKNEMKFKLLLSYAKKQNINLDQLIKSDIHKAMFEWRLSIESSHHFFKKLDKEKYTHLSYQDLTLNPMKSIKKIFDFLQINYNDGFIIEISKEIILQNKPIKSTDDKNLMKIGGNILIKTINNDYTP